MFRYLTPLIPIAFLVGFSALFYYSSLESLIAFLGVSNAYLIIFILAFVGGLTTFSGVPYHVILITFAAGGLNPFLLGLSAATGVVLGDSTSYYLGYQGRALLSPRLHKIFEELSFIKNKYPKLLPAIFFFFSALLPFSNDVITIPMGFLRYPFWRVMIPLALGNLVFNTWVALIAVYAYHILQILPFV